MAEPVFLGILHGELLPVWFLILILILILIMPLCRARGAYSRSRPGLRLGLGSGLRLGHSPTPLWQRLHLDRQHRRQVAHDRRPVIAAVRGAIDLAAAGAEIDAALVERIDGHRVA